MDTQVIVKGMDGKMYKQLQQEEAVLMCLDVPLYVRYLSRPVKRARASLHFEPWHITPSMARIVRNKARECVAEWVEYSRGSPTYESHFYIQLDDDKPEYVPYE